MKIAIAGYGLEGKSNYNYYAAQGGHDITIVDERPIIEDAPVGVPTILGENVFAQLQDFELVVRTASLNPHKIQTNGKIWSATNEFFAKCPVDIIGVTGSKGKGTTCSLIANILQAAGRKVHLVGNIGVPALDVLPFIGANDLVVYELSSFQLWDLEKSPHVAVILHMEPDHLDIHANMDEYVHAKANIRLHQNENDICFYHPTNQYTQQIIDMQSDEQKDWFEHRDWRWRAFRYAVPESRDPTISIAYVQDQVFCIKRADSDELSTISASVLKIPGAHNQQNACAAIDAALVYKVNDAAIKQGLSTFVGLPHRLKLVRKVNGISYYDDSIGTTPGSAIAAMKAFTQPKVMIFGGSSKGSQFDELAHVASQSNVRAAVLIGAEANKIEATLRDRNVLTFNIGSNVTIKEALAVAVAQAKEGDTVILSPACASFDMFKSYVDRGNQFIAAVNEL